MTIVIDTSLIIDFLRGDARALACLADGRRRGDGRLIASVLTRTEVRAGMRSHEESSTEQLFAQFVWIPVTEDIADVAGRFAQGYLRSHGSIDVTDYVIAATSVTISASLWTRNTKHFPMLKDVSDPYESQS